MHLSMLLCTHAAQHSWLNNWQSPVGPSKWEPKSCELHSAALYWSEQGTENPLGFCLALCLIQTRSCGIVHTEAVLHLIANTG